MSVFQKHAAVSQTQKRVWLATGLPSGRYYALGKAIAEIGQQRGLDIHACTSGGSYDNIELLREGRVKLALAQVDALDAVVVHGEAHAISKDQGDPEACERVSEPGRPTGRPEVVTYLYSEMVHMFLRPHFYVDSPANLKQVANQVWLGPPGSGSRLTAERLLEAAGIADRDISQFFTNDEIKDWKAASEKLVAPISDNGLYAFFWARAVPTLSCTKDKDQDPVYGLLEGDARIAALPPGIIDRMTEDSLYAATTIPLVAYEKKIRQGVPTIGIATVLIADKSSSAQEINDLIGTLKSNKSNIACSIGTELDMFDIKEQENGHLAHFVPIHPGAERHLKGSHLKSVWLAVAVLSILALPIYRSRSWLTKNQPKVSYAILVSVILFFLWCGFAFEITEAEGRFNPSFETIATSMQTILFYVLGVFHGGKPMTRQGENLLAWALFVIPLVFGWLTADVLKDGVRKLAHWLLGASCWLFRNCVGGFKRVRGFLSTGAPWHALPDR